MSRRLRNISNLLGDVKSRTIILATGGILLLALIIGLFGFLRSESGKKSAAELGRPPPIESVPGIKPTSPEYAKLQAELNKLRQQQAQQRGQSFVPTVVSKTDGTGAGSGLLGTGGQGGVGGLGSGGAGAGGAAGRGGTGGLGAGGAGANGANGQAGGTSGLSTGDAAALKAKLAALQAQMEAQQDQLSKMQQERLQQATQQAQQNMKTQAQSLMAAWNPAGGAAQSLVEGSALAELQQERQRKAQVVATAAAQIQQPPIVKAGTILFASLTTSVNSDEPGPILATIVSGKYKGARLIGSIQDTRDKSGLNRPTRLTLLFNTMNLPARNRTININAVAIDPNTARTALASHVDHHYLLRYGSLFASSFLEGYGNAVTQSGQIVTNLSTGSQITVSQELNPTEELAAGFGKLGQRWGEQMDKVFDRPNTITINAGSSLGILFLSDVTLTQPRPLVPLAPNVIRRQPLQQRAAPAVLNNPTVQRAATTAQQLVTNRSSQ